MKVVSAPATPPSTPDPPRIAASRQWPDLPPVAEMDWRLSHFNQELKAKLG
jgi:hypothetical protein